MIKIKIDKIIDILGKFFSIFFIFLVFFRCLKINFVYSFIFSILSSTIILLFIGYLKRIKNKKNNIKSIDIKLIENITEQFKFTSSSKIKQYLIQVFSSKYATTQNKLGFTYFVNQEKNLIYPFYDVDVLNPSDIIGVYKETQSSKVNNVYILCLSFSADCLGVVKRFKSKHFQILDIKALYYSVLKPSNILPDFQIEKINIKPTLKSIINSAFSRGKAKSYFWFGMLVFISSFFVPLSLYYLILSLVLFSLSFIARFIYPQPKIISSSIF